MCSKPFYSKFIHHRNLIFGVSTPEFFCLVETSYCIAKERGEPKNLYTTFRNSPINRISFFLASPPPSLIYGPPPLCTTTTHGLKQSSSDITDGSAFSKNGSVSFVSYWGEKHWKKALLHAVSRKNTALAKNCCTWRPWRTIIWCHAPKKKKKPQSTGRGGLCVSDKSVLFSPSILQYRD